VVRTNGFLVISSKLVTFSTILITLELVVIFVC
jgi:hypothetical protein